MRYPEIYTDTGNLVPAKTLAYAYLVWTMPERGLRFSDFVAVVNRFTEHDGLGKVAARDVRRLLKALNRRKGLPRNLFTGTYRVTDDQMKRRQLLVFEEGFRDTPLDKMARIRLREENGIPYHLQDRHDPSGVRYDAFAYLDAVEARA